MRSTGAGFAVIVAETGNQGRSSAQGERERHEVRASVLGPAVAKPGHGTLAQPPPGVLYVQPP